MASTQVNTYFAKGIREGLTETVADLFADDVPFFAMMDKVSVRSTKPEWQDDALASPSTTGIVEGASITYTQPATRVRHANYMHIRQRTWDVTFTQMAVEVAGIKDQIAREMSKAMKALLTDYDKIFLNTGNTAVGATATARTAKGIQKAIQTNTGRGSSAGGSTKQALTESKINALLQKIWAAGGDPRALFCGGYQKRVISTNFTAKTGFSFRIDASARTAIANINKYEGSFGTVDVIPDRQHNGMRVTIVTPDHLKVAVLRDIEQYKGAPTASSIKGWVEAEMSLIWGNEKAHAKQSHLKTSTVAGV